MIKTLEDCKTEVIIIQDSLVVNACCSAQFIALCYILSVEVQCAYLRAKQLGHFQ
jgi:hypothetical protein